MSWWPQGPPSRGILSQSPLGVFAPIPVALVPPTALPHSRVFRFSLHRLARCPAEWDVPPPLSPDRGFWIFLLPPPWVLSYFFPPRRWTPRVPLSFFFAVLKRVAVSASTGAVRPHPCLTFNSSPSYHPFPVFLNYGRVDRPQAPTGLPSIRIDISRPSVKF